jgi:hypothetical protein
MDDALVVRRLERRADLHPSRSASSTGMAPWRRRSASVSPSTSSSTSSVVPPASSSPWMPPTFAVERGQELRFAFEPPHAFRAGRELGRQRLERDLPAETCVPGAPHLAHAAAAER